MKWEKLDKIFSPNGEFGWINSHAQVPTVLVKENENIVRIYFAARPEPYKTLPSFIDIDINDFSKILHINEKPLLKLGRPGTFDEHGIMPSSVVEHDGKVYLYYSGWQRSVGVPYNNYTGVAISVDGGLTFEKYSEAPILDRNRFELYSATSPCVIFENNLWKMWYCSGVDWVVANGKMEHTYDIKFAHSKDGLNWIQESKSIIAQNYDMEAITKPSVVKIDNVYHMWFCYRGTLDHRGGVNSYKIGYASSLDGTKWIRDDENSGISLSAAGWDSNMIAYPEVVEINKRIFMFYNGNDFGAEGFGFAELR